MESRKMERARSRNWMKARIMGIATGMSGDLLTFKESKIIEKIRALRDKLLNGWDDGSTKLGMKVKPKRDRFKED